MRHQDGSVEQKLARIATEAHGLVTHEQLVDAELTRAQIRSRRQNGLLIAEYPCVYRVGHRAPSDESRYLAAVLACGDGALLNTCSAA